MVDELAREVVRELVQQTQNHRDEDKRATEFYRLANDFDNFLEQVVNDKVVGEWDQRTRKEFERLRIMAQYLLYGQPLHRFDSGKTEEA